MSFDDSRDTPQEQADVLRRGLRDAVPPPPMNDVDWKALHARIGVAARPALAELAAGRTATGQPQDQAPWLRAKPAQAQSVWQPLAGWSSRGIPLAAAASVLLMLGAAWLGTTSARDVSTPDVTSFRTLEEEFMEGLGAGAAPLLAGIGPDELLDAVLFYGGEGW
jgi:hypothetical protein